MKTAKEILKEMEIRQGCSVTKSEVILAMKAYAEQACEAQREECERNFRGISMKRNIQYTQEDLTALRNSISNAPKPELK